MALTYKLESFIKKITSPVVVEYDGKVQEFPNGAAVYEQDYTECLIVDEIKAVEKSVCIVLKKNDLINDDTWCDKETATFF